MSSSRCRAAALVLSSLASLAACTTARPPIAAVSHVQGEPSATPRSKDPGANPSTAPHDEVNNGQDITRPVRRLDLRYQYQSLGRDHESQILTARVDVPFVLSDAWKLGTRLDLPFLNGDVPSGDNPKGRHESGLGDVLAQALLIHPTTARTAVAGGAQFVFPTARKDQFGSGRYRIIPIVAAVDRPTWLPSGSFVGLAARYDFDVGGDSSREYRDAVAFQPILNLALPHAWFATMAPEIRIATAGDHDVFVPFDLTVGTMVDRTTVGSLEFKRAIVDDLEQYKWAVEFRIGFFF